MRSNEREHEPGSDADPAGTDADPSGAARPVRVSDADSVRHQFRTGALTPLRTFVAGPTGLLVEAEGERAELIRWDAIRLVQFEVLPGPDDGKILNLRIRHGKGRLVSVQNAHWAGPGNVEYRNQQFGAFAGALHRYLRPYRGQVKFIVGTRRMLIHAWRISVVLLALVTAVATAITTIGGDIGSAMQFGGVCGLSILAAVSLFRVGRPKPYDPDALFAGGDDKPSVEPAAGGQHG